ncbi:cupin-like domain-containing protein [Wenzhouxiangella sp. XN201]|uniref:cupin-like domain-containing protein n=1 Tax=Wenzhouxiangella sp. XN201 TaxID=2710755 RepID=UPI0013CA3E06|nr:cupin-like domain-containing protein [Wenzhouxiangella sp. XN201]NEZ04870.1 cupin-like domain-containing protein [Wenzhouxiangella sp. XN201]
MRPERTIEETERADASTVIESVNGRAEPLVLRGLCTDWPLVQAADSPDAVERLLLDHYEGAPVTAFLGESGNDGRLFYNDDISALNFKPTRTGLDAVLSHIRQAREQSPAPTVYMGSMAMDHCLPSLKPTHSLATHDLPTTVRIWIGNQSKVAAHHDVLDNIACVCVGERQFTLFPPEQLANLYLGPIDMTPAGQQVSLVDPDNPDFEAFPRYAEALEAGLWAELQPGDAIYIPSMWWHQVYALSSLNILINHWWRDVPSYMGAPGDVLIHGLMNLRGLPRRQREAWRHMFEYYIFDPPEDALAHIPESSRGVLGDMNEEQARQWRSMLRNKLNR